MNFIITRNPNYFKKIGKYNYCGLSSLKDLPSQIAVDTETTGLSALVDKVFSIQIGTGNHNYLIDLQEYDTPIEKGYQILISEVIPYLKNKTLVFHNASFDLSFFYMQGFYPINVRDTMIGSKILHNGEPPYVTHSFGAVMERELGITYDKSEQKNIHKVRLSTPKALHYCFNDVDKLLELESNLFQKLHNYGAVESYLLNCDYTRVLSYMEMCGLPINTYKWREKMTTDLENSNLRQLEIIDYIYSNLPQFRNQQLSLFNAEKEISVLLSSPVQVIPVFEAMGINVIDDEGKKSINEAVINKTKHEFVDLWLKYKESEHRVTTFGQKILDKVKWGHLYTRFNPIVDTCRISSRKGEINFLNFPSDKATRKCFEASKGFVMLGCDYANQEMRVLADKSQDISTIDVITKNLDAHALLAREVYPEIKNLTDDEIKKQHNDKRQIGKIANFTFAFGGNGYTAAKNLNLPQEEGEKLYQAYKKLHEGIFNWGEGVLLDAMKNGYIESAAGFKLKLPMFDRFQELQVKMDSFDKDFWTKYKTGKEENILLLASIEDKTLPPYVIQNTYHHQLYLKHKGTISEYFSMKSQYFRLCLNNPIQATAAHQTKKAACLLFNNILANDDIGKVRIAVIVHDEIQLEIKEELAEKYLPILSECMVIAGDHFLENKIVTMEADAVIGSSWAESK